MDLVMLNISLSENIQKELEEGFKLVKNPKNCFLNSASADSLRLENTTDLASKYNSNFYSKFECFVRIV